MNTPPPNPRWKRKRWIAAGLLWLILAYPLSLGPACYGTNRRWIDPIFAEKLYSPVLKIIDAADSAGMRSTIIFESNEDGETTMREIRQEPPWYTRPPAVAAKAVEHYLTWCGELGRQHASQP